jgi:pSer/pThr/pTyr-binding forkhead associated (FHA) protein
MAEAIAFLKALTPEAKESLGKPVLEIPHYPFRVGCENHIPTNTFFAYGRRQPDSSPHNDLYLIDSGPLPVISREHFQIERRNGVFILVDRQSTCGTLVEGETIGMGRNCGEKQLENGDVIIVGTSESRQAFKFIIWS